MRPITSMIDSPADKTAAYLTRIISPVLGRSEYSLSNSASFVEQIKTIQLSEDDMLVSFDVTSLFTRVPTEEAVDVICAKLQDDDTLAERCELSVPCTY